MSKITINTKAVYCSVCNRGWLFPPGPWKVVKRQSTEEIPLKDFVGKSLQEVQDHYFERMDACYFMTPDTLIRNDRYIDLSIDPSGGYPKNKLGWVGNQEGVTPDYVVQEGDVGFFYVGKYYHPDCSRIEQLDWYGNRFWALFDKVGYQDIELTAIPNQYCNCETCGPWFKVATDHGTFTIGWRKRVIHLEGDVGINFAELFQEESVTMGSNHIHAWGWDAAEKYLKRIHNTHKT